MGLHLCYELSLPGDRSEREVAERLVALQACALALPLDRVSEVVRLDACELAEPAPLGGLADERLEHLVHRAAHFHRDSLYRDWLGLGEDDEYELVDEHTRVYRPVVAPADVPTSAIGFAVAPGRGSEPATFALTRLSGPEVATRWCSHCCCKTQYASALGDEHLLRCHGSLVRLLDVAMDQGFEVVVRDETGYWTSRDPQQLVDAVAAMNRIVARFAGTLTDAIRAAGGDSRQVGGAIFDHPEFERLEGADG